MNTFFFTYTSRRFAGLSVTDFFWEGGGFYQEVKMRDHSAFGACAQGHKVRVL